MGIQDCSLHTMDELYCRVEDDTIGSQEGLSMPEIILTLQGKFPAAPLSRDGRGLQGGCELRLDLWPGFRSSGNDRGRSRDSRGELPPGPGRGAVRRVRGGAGRPAAPVPGAAGKDAARRRGMGRPAAGVDAPVSGAALHPVLSQHRADSPGPGGDLGRHAPLAGPALQDCHRRPFLAGRDRDEEPPGRGPFPRAGSHGLLPGAVRPR